MPIIQARAAELLLWIAEHSPEGAGIAIGDRHSPVMLDCMKSLDMTRSNIGRLVTVLHQAGFLKRTALALWKLTAEYSAMQFTIASDLRQNGRRARKGEGRLPPRPKRRKLIAYAGKCKGW
jgi:DNA-binding IclR family transcriptional regulator